MGFDGIRKGFALMTREEFVGICEGLFGKHGWYGRAAQAMCVTERSVRRWASGDVSIDGRTASHITALSQSRALAVPGSILEQVRCVPARAHIPRPDDPDGVR